MMAAFIALFGLAGCACVTTEYKAFEGTRAWIVQGEGGAKVVVDGMEIWVDGEPPHKFMILGLIDYSRESNWMYAPPQRSVVVKKARQAGGDAVIKLNSQNQFDDYYMAGGASAGAYSVYVRNSIYDSSEMSISKYAVIKYLKKY